MQQSICFMSADDNTIAELCNFMNEQFVQQHFLKITQRNEKYFNWYNFHFT